MAKTDNKPAGDDIRQVLEAARKAAHDRLAERKARNTEVLERSEKVQERLRRAAS
jgi:hypothetical protein